MPSCELCGASGNIVRVLVESVEVRVCLSCARYGKVLSSLPSSAVHPQKPAKHAASEPLQVIVPDFAARIKSSREKLGMSQEGLARLLNEKKTIIHYLEVGKIAPSMPLARKLESLLKIKIIHDYQESRAPQPQNTSSFTLGDFIRVKKA